MERVQGLDEMLDDILGLATQLLHSPSGAIYALREGIAKLDE